VFSDKKITKLFNNIYEGKMANLEKIDGVTEFSPKLYKFNKNIDPSNIEHSLFNTNTISEKA
jgi:hypothetical protein